MTWHNVLKKYYTMKNGKFWNSCDLSHLQNLLKNAKDINVYKRIQCVYLKASKKLGCKEISEIICWSHGSVRNVHAEYIKHGDETFNLNGKGGRYHENLSLSEEKEIIKSLEKKGKEGGILEISKIKEAYEKKANKEVNKTVIYRMLYRHNWRKISPRKNHPKNKKENIDTFKKTSGVWYQKPNGRQD